MDIEEVTNMNNQWPNQKEVEELRKRYPKGTEVVLIKMDDVQAPPPGMTGIVSNVDDAGTVHVQWSNGSTLGVVYGVDIIKKTPDEY